MGHSYSRNKNYHDQGKTAKKGLLGSGWRPFYRQFDPDYFWHLLSNDTWELVQKTLDVTSDLTDALGRNHYAWWANLTYLFSENTQYEIGEFWDYVTPELPARDRAYKRVLSVKTPNEQIVSRDLIPIHYVLDRFQEITLFKLLNLLGNPDSITQCFEDRDYYYPVQKFIDWEMLEIVGSVQAFWRNHEGVCLEISAYEGGHRNYALYANQITSLISKATYNLSVLVSGYQCRVGQVQSQYTIRSFPLNIQAFTDEVQEAILTQERLAVLVHGKPGTGKTVWTQAVAKEILVALGYVVFILDHDAVENFIPPEYLERICLLINEVDNLAQDRSFEAAQYSNKTEHILSLLDGTLYQSVLDESNTQPRQKLVILMTCNTTERLDPAFLRKGRVDLIYEFTHQFV